jgi:hypothetical protein
MDIVVKPDSLTVEKTLTDFPKHEENPFMHQLVYMRNTRNKIVASGAIYGAYDTSTGEVHENKTVRSWVIERVDNEQFTKLYDNYLQVVFGLSPRALKLFQYFVTALKFNDERVIFDIRAAKKMTGYNSKQTISMALAELIAVEIIARSPAANIYYINPKIFVKGNRMDMLQTWVRKNTPEDIALTEEMRLRDAQQRQLNLFKETQPEEAAHEYQTSEDHTP